MLYGEAPHIASLTLLPAALLAWDLAIERRRAPYVLLAAVAIAATVLTSWLGAFALALMIVAHVFSRPMKRRDWIFAVLIAAASYALAMPWAPPSTIAATQFNSKTLGGDFRETYLALPVWALLALIATAALSRITRNLDRGLRFAILFTVLVASVVVAWTWFGIAVTPQPIRYHLELEMALSMLVAVAAKRWLRPRPAAIAIGLLCLALIPAVRASRRYARALIQPVDITQTAEWKNAQWLNRQWTGERVMMPGSTSFWLTAFSDVPQLNGGTEQGVVDYMARVAAYGIYYGVPYSGGHNGEFSILWLKALGAQAVGVSGPSSGEFYKPFLDPRQFEGLLEPIYREGGDTIYRVGVAHASLARIVPRSSLVTRTPKNGVDVEPLRPYVAALDDPAMPLAEFRWTSMHSARIAADLQSDQVISVQIAWHRGWRASANGRAVPIHQDAIGLIVLDPGPGRHDIETIFDGGIEMRAASVFSAMAAVMLAGGSLLSLRRKA